MEAIPMCTLNIPLFYLVQTPSTLHRPSPEDLKDTPKLSLFASQPGLITKSQWLKLPMSSTTFHGPNDV